MISFSSSAVMLFSLASLDARPRFGAGVELAAPRFLGGWAGVRLGYGDCGRILPCGGIVGRELAALVGCWHVASESWGCYDESGESGADCKMIDCQLTCVHSEFVDGSSPPKYIPR